MNSAVHAVLDQVRDIGVAQASAPYSAGRQAQRVPVGREPGVDLRGPDPPAALGQPQRR